MKNVIAEYYCRMLLQNVIEHSGKLVVLTISRKSSSFYSSDKLEQLKSQHQMKYKNLFCIWYRIAILMLIVLFMVSDTTNVGI